jgi:tRNA(Ile)-lysidine synthase
MGQWSVSLLDRIARTIERYGMFRRGMKVGVAVSGGADSVCLLHVLLEHDLRLHVLHLNHNLRGEESRGDAEFVRELAAGLRLSSTIGEAHFANSGLNLEQAGREARLAFFREAIAGGIVERVALGHTRSDQAETVLFRFLRGSGTAGLAGIRPVTADGIVRPMIEVDRADVELYLRERGIGWREDATNASPEFDRNRIRIQLLPQLEREWNPAIRETLAQVADWALGEEAYWDEELNSIWARLRPEKEGPVLLNCEALERLPLAAARRVVRRAIERGKGDLRGVGFPHIAAILDLASRRRGHGRVQVPGLEVLRSFDWLRFQVPHPPPGGYRMAAPVPGKLRVPGSRLVISLELLEKSETFKTSDYVYNSGMGGLEWARLSGSLEMRNWQPGDRYQPTGSTGEEKIKTLFQQARIPLWERRQWPVLLDGESIVWVRRFGAAAGVAANSGSRSILSIREMETN